MNTNEIKLAILDKVESDNKTVVEAICTLRDFANECESSVCWTIIRGAKRYGTARVSEKQANVLARLVASLTEVTLRNNFTDEQLAVFGINFTPAPTEPEAEPEAEVKPLTATEQAAKAEGMTCERYVTSTPERWNAERAAHPMTLTADDLRYYVIRVERKDSLGYNHTTTQYLKREEEARQWIAENTVEKDHITVYHGEDVWIGWRQKRNMERRTFNDGSLRAFMWMYRPTKKNTRP